MEEDPGCEIDIRFGDGSAFYEDKPSNDEFESVKFSAVGEHDQYTI